MDALGLMGALGAISGAGLKAMNSGSAQVNGMGGATISPPTSASMALISWPINTNSGLVIAATILVKGGSAILLSSSTTNCGTATWSSGKLAFSNELGSTYYVNAVFFG